MPEFFRRKKHFSVIFWRKNSGKFAVYCLNWTHFFQSGAWHHILFTMADHVVRSRVGWLPSRGQIVRFLPGLSSPHAYLPGCCGELRLIDLLPVYSLRDWPILFESASVIGRFSVHHWDFFRFFVSMSLDSGLNSRFQFVLYRESEVLATECDMPMIHCLLSKIPPDLPVEHLISNAGDLYVQYPPDELANEAQLHYKQRFVEDLARVKVILRPRSFSPLPLFLLIWIYYTDFSTWGCDLNFEIFERNI